MRSGIILMTRIPKPGATKSRLQGILSPTQCAEFHQACIYDEIQVLNQLGWPVYFCYFTGDSGTASWSAGAIEKACGLRAGMLAGWQLLEQKGDTLGDRMQNAIELVLSENEAALIVGSDMPWLTAERLIEATWLLQDKDAVIGPALDGGYYLLGLKNMEPELFAGIPWGTNQVLSLTRHKLAKKGLSYSLLLEEQDLDLPAAFHNFYKRGQKEVLLQQLASYRYLSNIFTAGEGHYEQDNAFSKES